jgi:hypothetical protein
MLTRRKFWRFMDSPIVEWAIFGLGVVLLILSPIVGALPGPGGIIIAGIGLAMVLKTSVWARRRYVKFKRWQPKAGRWTDWALRRPSARRREAIRKAQRQQLNAAESPAGPAPGD